MYLQNSKTSKLLDEVFPKIVKEFLKQLFFPWTIASGLTITEELSSEGKVLASWGGRN